MTTDDIEADLRDALAQKAAEVPAHAADRLKQLNYRPRTMRGQPAAVVGLATAVLAAGGGYLASSLSTTSQNATPVSLAAFTLPAGFTATRMPCAPLPPGVGAQHAGHGEAGFAAGASAHGGCVEAALISQAVRPPSSATPTPVGRYQGFMTGQASDRTITLYVEIPTAKGAQELVVVARNLSGNQVADIARRTLATQ
jgi:hypothetical protein